MKYITTALTIIIASNILFTSHASAQTKQYSKKVYDLYNRGVEKQNDKNYQGAVSDFTKAIKEDSTFYLAYYNRALAEIFLDKYTEAVQDLDINISFNDKAGIAYYFRAVAKMKLRKKEEACADFLKAKELGHVRDQAGLVRLCN